MVFGPSSRVLAESLYGRSIDAWLGGVTAIPDRPHGLGAHEVERDGEHDRRRNNEDPDDDERLGAAAGPRSRRPNAVNPSQR